jgi:hypothetical protein
MDFEGFNATARYWKLIFTTNHGAHQTSFHGIEFFGYDNRISKLIEQLYLNEYEDVLYENVIYIVCVRRNFIKRFYFNRI